MYYLRTLCTATRTPDLLQWDIYILDGSNEVISHASLGLHESKTFYNIVKKYPILGQSEKLLLTQKQKPANWSQTINCLSYKIWENIVPKCMKKITQIESTDVALEQLKSAINKKVGRYLLGVLRKFANDDINAQYVMPQTSSTLPNLGGLEDAFSEYLFPRLGNLDLWKVALVNNDFYWLTEDTRISRKYEPCASANIQVDFAGKQKAEELTKVWLRTQYGTIENQMSGVKYGYTYSGTETRLPVLQINDYSPFNDLWKNGEEKDVLFESESLIVTKDRRILGDRFRLWNKKTFTEIDTSWIDKLQHVFALDGNSIIYSSNAGICRWELNTNISVVYEMENPGLIYQHNISYYNNRLAMINNGEVIILNTQTMKCVLVIGANDYGRDYFRFIDFRTPVLFNRHFTILNGKQLTIWDANSGTLLISKNISMRCVCRVGDLLVLGCNRGKIYIVNPETGKTVLKWQAHDKSIKAIGSCNNVIISISKSEASLWQVSPVINPAKSPFITDPYKKQSSPFGKLF